jgi:hypothetical protein
MWQGLPRSPEFTFEFWLRALRVLEAIIQLVQGGDRPSTEAAPGKLGAAFLFKPFKGT